MNRNFLLLACMAPLAAMVSSRAEAGETGAARGQVMDDQDLPVPGAEVVITGTNIAGERVVVTDDNGEFRMLALPPGPKDVMVRKEGFAPTRYTVVIRLDETAFVPVVLKATAGATEEIIVTEKLPVVDSTRSAVSQQMTSDLLENTPAGRSYSSALNMVPGVSGRVDTQNGGPSNGNPSVRGEGQYGNNYLVDGISTRNPATKTFGSKVNFDAIQEIQVYTDGYPAEFSNATGMLVNVVTKDGGNEHFGSAGYFLNMPACYNFSGESTDPATLSATDLAAYIKKNEGAGCYYDILNTDLGYEVPTRKRSFMNHELSLTAGGPLIKNKLWYFAAADLGAKNIQFEALPADSPYTAQSLQGVAKITYFPTSDISLQYLLNVNMDNATNIDTSGLLKPDAQGASKSHSFTHTLSARWRPSEANELELKLSRWNQTADAVPVSGDVQAPAIRDENGIYTGNYDSFDYNDRVRTGGTLKFTQLVSNVLGDHKFKAGLEMWRLDVTRQLEYTGEALDSQFQSEPWFYGQVPGANSNGYLLSSSAEYPCTAPDYTDCAGIRQSGNVDPISSYANLFGLFVQDDWTIKPVTFNLGFRMDRESLFQNDGTKIIDQYMPAPRFGAAWDITRDSKTVMTVNAGRYYDVNGNDFVQWANTRSSNGYIEYRNDGNGGYNTVWVQDPATNPLVYCTQESLQQLQNDTLASDGTAKEPTLTKEQADTIWKDYCDNTKLRPYHMDKLVVGIKREIMPLLAVGLKGIMSHSTDFPEDVNFDDANWVVTDAIDPATGLSQKVRDYRALELTVERKFDGVWQLLASYTLSESKGDMPGQFEIASGGTTGSSGNEVGVYLDDVSDAATRLSYFRDYGYGWYLDGLSGLGRLGNDAGHYGYLPYHALHNVKLSGSYKLPSNTSIGAVYEFSSGNAWQKDGFVELYGDYFAFPEGRGTRFMPAVHYVNLRVSQEFAFGDKKSLEISLDAFNVLDLQTPITYYQNEGDTFGMVLYRQEPLAFQLGATFKY